MSGIYREKGFQQGQRGMREERVVNMTKTLDITVTQKDVKHIVQVKKNATTKHSLMGNQKLLQH